LSFPLATTGRKRFPIVCRHAAFEFLLSSDPLYNRFYVSDVLRATSAAKAISTLCAACNKHKETLLLSTQPLPSLFKTSFGFSLTFSPPTPPVLSSHVRLSAANLLRNQIEHDIFQPHAPMDEHVPTLPAADIRAIIQLRHPTIDTYLGPSTRISAVSRPHHHPS
jgi:hypothetical protein